MRRLFFLLTFCVLCFSITNAQNVGDTFIADNINYKITKTNPLEVEVSKKTENYSGSITIPQEVIYNNVTYTVTSIGNQAFYRCSGLTSITIPDNVTSIGREAFYRCENLTSVNIPNGVSTIGNNTFGECNKLTSIIIPSSVTDIKDGAFKGCRGLTSITIPSSVTSIGTEAFRECSKLTSISIPNGVTSIGNEAFRECSNLTSITIPSSVTSIGKKIIYECSKLATIDVDTDNTMYYSSGNCIIEKETKTLVLGCKSSIIPNNITAIGNNAFDGCTKLTSVTIPDGVTSIGSYAFQSCTQLTTIIIPNSVTTIEKYAFYNCTSLTSITIPNSVTSIGRYAFHVTKWYNSFAEGTIYINNILYKYKGNMPENTTINIKEGTTTIGAEAFYGCLDNLTSIYIPNSVTTIGENAFSNCSNLTSIYIPNSVTTIENYAFSNCSNLKKVICLATEVPTCQWGIFSNTTLLDTLLVPIGNVEAYKNTTQWNNFSSNIVGGYVVNGFSTNETMGNVSVLHDIVEPNKTTTLTATATDGHYFIQWSDGNTENPRTITVVSDTTFTAEFGCNVYNVVAADVENGSVAIEGEYKHGSTITLTATANEGYHFTQWSDGNTENPRTAVVVSDTTFTAEFGCNVYNVIAADVENGSVAIEGEYKHGSTITLTATATDGYHFTQWSDGNTENPRTITVVSDTTFTAEFGCNVYNVIVADVENGSVAIEGEYKHGSTITLTATATSGYHFTQWSDGNTENPRTAVVVSDTTFTAVFAINVYNVVAADVENGSVAIEGEYKHGSTITLTATATEGYHFTQWSDGNTENPRTAVVVSDTSFTAEFAINVYNVVAADVENGSVSIEGEYKHGSTITLTATATEGYHFTQWSDGNTENPRTAVVVSDITFTAVFAKDSEQGNGDAQEEGGNTNNNENNGETNNQEEDKNNNVAISENEAAKLLVYPSPATSVVTIDGVKPNSQVKVYNINGAIVVATTLDGNSLNVANLAKGTYIIETENGTTARFVKQ